MRISCAGGRRRYLSASTPSLRTTPSSHPDLQKQVKEAYLTFDWKGTGLEKDFGKRANCFIPVDYAKHWKVIRTIQKANNVVYNQESLKTLKAGKKKKPKKK